MCRIRWIKSLDCLICVILMLPRFGIKTFVMALTNLWSALLTLDTMALTGMSPLFVLCKPYRVGAVEWYIINLVQDLFSVFINFMAVLLKSSVVLFLLFVHWFYVGGFYVGVFRSDSNFSMLLLVSIKTILPLLSDGAMMIFFFRG